MKVFMQLDDEFETSFIWSENLDQLHNILISVYGETNFILYGGEKGDLYGYPSNDHFQLKHTLSIIFDEIVVFTTNEVDGEVFIESCKEYLNETN